jgi:hypothetical protein
MHWMSFLRSRDLAKAAVAKSSGIIAAGYTGLDEQDYLTAKSAKGAKKTNPYLASWRENNPKRL